ncbi:MAG: glycosyltransferase [Campylobacterales bacterium]|nr:glycosyltransferase [Campylobacterales bacterium]
MIAYFVYNLNKYSGASQQALSLAKSMKMPIAILNHEKGIGFSKKKINEHVEQINLPSNRLLALLYLIFFLLIKKVKVIHLHGFFKHGILLARFLRKKVILKTTLMGSDDFESLYRKARYKKFIKFLIGCVDVNICLTRQLYNKNRNFIDESKIKIIPNGVALPTNVLTQKENIFCFVGLICERKGAFESIEYYLKNYLVLPGSKMYVVGPLEGLNESDSSYVKKCHTLVAQYGASDSVIFTGNIPNQDVQDIFRISKALIFFSKNEGMPNVVLEAMSHNCLPITLGLDGVVIEILGGNIDSQLTLTDPRHVIDVNVMNQFIKNSDLSRIAREKFSMDSISFKYQGLYEVLSL